MYDAFRDLLLLVVGVKRNAERDMFSEPRPPVDALRAPIRESRFSFREAGADVNFLVTFAKRALLGPKVPLLLIFRIFGPNLHFCSGMHFLAQNRLWAKKGSDFIKIPLVL